MQAIRANKKGKCLMIRNISPSTGVYLWEIQRTPKVPDNKITK